MPCYYLSPHELVQLRYCSLYRNKITLSFEAVMTIHTFNKRMVCDVPFNVEFSFNKEESTDNAASRKCMCRSLTEEYKKHQ